MPYETGAAFKAFKGGLDAGKEYRKSRQEEEMRDIVIRDAKDAEGAHRQEMEDEGMTPSDWGMNHPWLDKLFGMTKGFGPGKLGKAKGAPMPLSLTTSGGEPKAPTPIAPEDIYSGPAPTIPEEALDEESAALADGRFPRRALMRFDDGTPPGGNTRGAGMRMSPEEQAKLAEYEKQVAKGNAQIAADKAARAETLSKAEAARDVKGARNVKMPNESLAAKTGRTVARGRGALARSGLVRGGLVPGYLLATAGDVADTDTEDYRRRLGMELKPGEDATFWGDVGVRTAGAITDLLPDFLRERLYDDVKEKQAREQTAPVAAPAPAAKPAEPAAPAPTPTAPAPTTTAGAGGGAASRTRTALSRDAEGKPAEPQDMVDITKINLSNARPEDIPDFQTRDWVAFREKATKMAVARGMPLAQAVEASNTQVQRMQQQSFNHFAQQAAQLLRAGNQQGAMAAIKAAYQMFPSGDDVKLGTYNGQVYGITIDEETGKPTGKPTAITPESIYAMIDQSKKEGEWNKYAKDQRDFAQTLRQYEEVDKPLAEEQASHWRRGDAISALNADTMWADAQDRMTQRARVAAAQGGLKPSDVRMSEEEYRQRLGLMQMDDPARYDDLTSKMSKLKARNPGVPDNVIMQYVMDRDRSQGNTE